MAIYLGRNQVTTRGGAGGSTNIQYQTKTVDPKGTSVSVKPDEGYSLSEVIVNPIPSTYVGIGVTRKSAATYTPGDSDIVISQGQYLVGDQTIKAVQTETKTVTANGTYSPSSSDKYFSSFTVNVPPSGVTLPLLTHEAGPEQVLSGGQLISSENTIVEGTMPNIGAANGTISTKTETYTIAKGYHDGTGQVSISSTEQAKIVAENIKSGVSILGVTGTYAGSGSGISVVLGTSANTQVASGSSYGGSLSVTYSSNKPTPTLSNDGTSITLSLSGTSTLLSNISSSTDFSVLQGKYISGTTSRGSTSSYYFIPSGSTFTVGGSTYQKTLTCNKAQKVTMSLS